MVQPFDYRRENYGLYEYYADQFACALLMPIEDVQHCGPVELANAV